jgi:ATP phosphoribosyltransferase regulatory subunit HisZ
MIYAHEIPSNSRLYFARSAKIKRELEYKASISLDESGYEEIVTPFFSYHQHSDIDEKSLIRFSDNQNHILSMRADSTLDVARIITKRLGRSVKQKKWFYIQPVFRYPSDEYYQIGAEYLGNEDLSVSINDSAKIIKSMNLSPTLQISNINIPNLIAKNLNISLEVFKSANLEELFKLDISWLIKLASLQNISQIDEIIDEVPEYLKEELQKIASLCQKISYENIIVSPLYYSKMRYYDTLFFRFFEKNRRLGMGGTYIYDDINSTGFALYTDNIIEELINQ